MTKAASTPESYPRFVSKDEPRFGKFYNSGPGALLIIALTSALRRHDAAPRRTKQLQPILFPGHINPSQIQFPILLAAPFFPHEYVSCADTVQILQKYGQSMIEHRK
jgi:hypothetical protein